MYVVDLCEFNDLKQCCRGRVERYRGTQVSRVEHRSVLGGNDRHDNAPSASDSRWARGWWWCILLKKPDPGVSVVRLRVSAGGVEHAFDRVRGAGHVGPAF